MSCDDFLPDLVPYHFGALEGDARAALEEHLAGCPACVRAFVDTKRAIETGAEGPRPRAAARARLRRAVAIEVGAAAPPRRWWERPVAFAVAASLLLFASAASRALTDQPGAPPYGAVAR